MRPASPSAGSPEVAPSTRTVTVVGRVLVTAARVAAPLIAAALALTGCSGGSSGGSAAPSGSPSPSDSATPAAQTLAALAAKASLTDFAGTYALDSVDPAKPDGTARIYKKGALYRVDVTIGSTRSLLMTTSAGAVSCQVTRSKTSCLRVAKPGQPLPKLFDPGLQRIFTTTLQAFAQGADALTVAANGTLPESGAMAVAQCFTVSGGDVDPGEYCLTDDGIVRRAQFPAGTITLQSYARAVLPVFFKPPVPPTPLP